MEKRKIFEDSSNATIDCISFSCSRLSCDSHFLQSFLHSAVLLFLNFFEHDILFIEVKTGLIGPFYVLVTNF